MAKLVYMEAPREDLAGVPIKNGQIINCIDSNEVFYDNANTVRLLSSRIEVVPIASLSTHEYTEDKVYVIRADILDNSYVSVLKNGILTQVTSTGDIANTVTTHTQLRSGVFTKGGVPYSPAVLTRTVFTDDGDSLQDLIKYINECVITLENIISTDDRYEFDIDVPDGITYGVTIVYKDGIFMNPDSYTTDYTNKKIRFTTLISQGQQLTLVHNLAIKPSFSTGVSKYINGGYLQNKTVDISKIKKVATSYTELQNDSLVPQELLYQMYANINNRLDNLDPTSVVRATDASSNSYQIVTTIRNFRLIDCMTIMIRTSYDLGTNCTIKINNMDPIPIYTFDGTPIKDGIVFAGRTITLRYNAQSNRFYLMNGDMYRLVTYRSIQKFDGVQNSAPSPTVPIGIDSYVHGLDKLEVYQNNIRLFEGINFNVTGTTIYLDGYYAEPNDIFVIEVTRVIPNNE